MFECEENFCENVQSAICLDCMHRLCIYHIEDHQKVQLSKVDELKNQFNQVSIDLTKISNTMVKERKVDEKKLTAWRKQKIAEIEREYSKMRNSIKNRQKILEQMQLKLNQRLKVEVQQPLEHMCTQKSTNPQLLDAIQLSIETLKKDSALLIWNSQQSDNVDNSNTCNNDKREGSSSILPTAKYSKGKKVEVWKPRNLLSKLFKNVGRNSGAKIDAFIQRMMKGEKQMENFGLITLIFSYLQTWYQTKMNQSKLKQLILSRHILTVKYYMTGRDCEKKVLLALIYFFNGLKHKGPREINMMIMLLQLFVDYQCISMSKIVHWYLKEDSIDKIIGKKVDKTWAKRFVKQHGYGLISKSSTSSNVTNTSSNSFKTLSTNTIKYSSKSTSNNKHVPTPKLLKKLVALFKDSSKPNDTAVHSYIQMQYRTNIYQRVIMIVRCYLKAWNECVSNRKNEFLLEKVSIIKYYEYDPDFEIQIICAIQIFLLPNKKKGDWSIQTISTLLQFFLDQNCLKKSTILDWNSNGNSYNDVYYKETKRYAQPFIQQLMASN